MLCPQFDLLARSMLSTIFEGCPIDRLSVAIDGIFAELMTIASSKGRTLKHLYLYQWTGLFKPQDLFQYLS
jgi:hypothetical protein